MTAEDIKKYSREVGYVAVGYVSPDLGSEETYPEYIEQEVNRCVAEIKSKQSDSSITFGFMTDIHYSHTFNHNIRMTRTMNAYREIARQTGVDMLILGGDYTNDGVKAYKENNYRELRAHFSGIKYYPANGNHDDNSIWDLWQEYPKSYNHLSLEEIYNIFYNHLPSLGASFDKRKDGLYYYIDDSVNRFRYIFLDSNDIETKYDDGGKLIYTKQHTFAYSKEQLDWLTTDALGDMETGWSVVVITHTAANYDMPLTGEDKNISVLNEILGKYKTGGKIEGIFNEGEFEVSLCVDFSKRSRGELIGVFSGHQHDDRVYISGEKIPYIFRANTIMYNTRLPRIDGEKSEILFDFVTIDKKAGKIYITRVGAGEGTEVDYR